MLVYNIRKAKYAKSLKASGVANRWNKQDEFIIYSGSSRALSALELVVHRSGIQLYESYKVLIIEINARAADIKEIKPGDLPVNWQSIAAYTHLQKIGSDWYNEKKKLLLKVPSAIIPMEHNFLINTRHPKFETHVKIKDAEVFHWDDRLL
ncbi:MAG: RES family NAD+ phosphorylase [Niabella sp.]|nr:RES family NAD+ phosphorylase [Niabella sp.]